MHDASSCSFRSDHHTVTAAFLVALEIGRRRNQVADQENLAGRMHLEGPAGAGTEPEQAVLRDEGLENVPTIPAGPQEPAQERRF
jgi:hypothetical protein